MPRYLTLFKYSAEGSKGFLKEKAAGREVMIRKAIESVGGKIESIYWAGSGGDFSGIAISELPDTATGAAFMPWSKPRGRSRSSERSNSSLPPRSTAPWENRCRIAPRRVIFRALRP